MRNKIFISHATPDDNDFTRWLALKLIALGYEVWCDILFLDKGGDFWKDINNAIRENSIKFLLVTSSISVNREGVLKELAVAEKVKKKLQDNKFIIPLIIDENLSYDDLPPEIIRLNAIDFKNSWAIGLKDLLEALEKQNVPKQNTDYSKSNLLYQQIFLHNKSVIEKEEIYVSNWFSILSFPDELRFHDFDWRLPKKFDVRTLTFPAIRYKKYLCTFAWEYDFMEQLPKTEAYDNTNSIRIPTNEILSGEFDSNIISNSEAKRLIVQLLNMAFESHMNRDDLRDYQMSNKVGYWFEKDKLEKNKFNKILFVGTQKNKSWHYGISGESKLYPFPVLMVSSHIFFTEDGKKLIESNSIQHSARRKQSKNWWNDIWRLKLLAFIKYLSNNEDAFDLEVGAEERITISSDPLHFKSQVSYDIPMGNNLQEEVELESVNDFDEIDEKIIASE
jgi:hypothetical protein